MKADNIITIMEQMQDLPYKCILFNGIWGIGKSYAIEQAIKGKHNVCKISMFGIKNTNQIYHEALFQLLINNKQGGKFASNIKKGLKTVSEFSEKLKKVTDVVDGVLSEKELFVMMTEKLREYQFIVLDDLERISESVSLKETLGIVEELKKCNYIKVILVANREALNGENQNVLEEYCEKVIDRVYEINERPEHINYGELSVEAPFLTAFLEKHPVKNLRTIRKAQNLYEDIEVQGKGIGNVDFWKDIRLVCYAIVVEEIEKLYFNSEIEKETGPDQAFHKIMNDFEMRLRQYLFNVKVTRELIHMIQEYYLRSEGIDKVALEIQYKLFLKAGDKPNLYKSEEEIRQYLKACQQEIKSSEEWQGLNQVMNEYVYWCKVLKEDYEDMLELYQRLQTELLWKEAKEGKEENLLLYESGPYLELQEEVGNRFSDVLCEVRKRQVDMFITYLKENTSDKRAFMYSTKLREYSNSNSMRYEKLIEERIRELLLRSSFPIDNMTEDKNNTCYNILAVLYKYAREETETYKEQLLKECDKMESYRIKTLLRE